MLLQANLSSTADSSDFRRYERACLDLYSAREDFQRARDEIDLAFRRAGEGAAGSADAIRALWDNRDVAARRVEGAEAAVDRAALFHGPAPVLSPYVILDAKAAEIGNLRALFKMALDKFEGDWRKAAPKKGRKGGMRPQMPGDVLAEMLVQLIGRFWRAEGLDRISPTPTGDGDNGDSRTGKFEQLLVAFHFYACGEDLSGEDANTPRRRPDGSTISGRPFAEALEKVSGYVQAERARLKVSARISGAEKKRREGAVAEAREWLKAGGRPTKRR